MATKKSTNGSLFERLCDFVEEIAGEPLTPTLKKKLKEVAEAAKDIDCDLYELLPESVVEELLGEDYNSTWANPVPVTLSNGGVLDNEVNIQFTKDNACPYFNKDEMCILDGRICMYDTQTFPVCPKYKEGHTRRIPGVDGNAPAVPPQSEIPKNPVASTLPYNSPYHKS